MSALIEPVDGAPSLRRVARCLRGESGVTFLRSDDTGHRSQRLTLLAARPMLSMRVKGAVVETVSAGKRFSKFGNPWEIVRETFDRYEIVEHWDHPFPLGGLFGYWGYELKNAIEPRARSRALDDLEAPDAALFFCPSLLVSDRQTRKTFIVATGLNADGDRSIGLARRQRDAWRRLLDEANATEDGSGESFAPPSSSPLSSNMSRDAFLHAVEKAQAYIRSGDIYQVNLSHRLRAPRVASAWEFFEALSERSPAPFSGWIQTGDFAVASASPEQFLQLSGREIRTCPIKGTRPRSKDPNIDARNVYELKTSAKENAELIMITDLLRNDLGRICEYGSVETPRLLDHEVFPHVHHLVSEVRGRLWPHLSHADALSLVFPGGSITGAPKIRAMDIIDELEANARGPYTGTMGYLGFNRESQLNILIRTALISERYIDFPVGSGIVSDSDPEAEYEETLVKAGGFLDAIHAARESLTDGIPGRPIPKR